MGLLLLFFFRYNFNWYYIYSDINLVVFPSRFLLLAISFTISPCSLLLLHLCAMVYCTLIYQACQVTSFISFQVLIQVTFFLFIAARHSSSLKADCHAIHRAALCTDDNFFDYIPISSQVFQWWYSFGWLGHDESMCNVYKWYKTHAVLSLWSPTDYYLFHHVLRIHSSTFASVLSWIHIS